MLVWTEADASSEENKMLGLKKLRHFKSTSANPVNGSFYWTLFFTPNDKRLHEHCLSLLATDLICQQQQLLNVYSSGIMVRLVLLVVCVLALSAVLAQRRPKGGRRLALRGIDTN